ncbi:MAG: hypothetical protein CMJ46_05885 [Planctomyces sp.]|nr:hypothetical protein [Planctomyces sp.]
MFGLFKKNPLKKLKQDYGQCLQQARDLQRNGDIKGFADMSAKAEEILQQIDLLEENSNANQSD